MLHQIPMSEAKQRFLDLPGRLAKHPGAIAVTTDGKPVMVLMPWGVYESIVKTLEQWSDKNLVEALRQGICSMQAAKNANGASGRPRAKAAKKR
ncbi:MAG: type II toxin-antitoxin system Phd/YefM family antitoxin [Deltaproteobacteria bacterium]|nr:type II toxin-antitoxin system Phd/YefM family antitoxin [Deltaproteobacteria bacterium]